MILGGSGALFFIICIICVNVVFVSSVHKSSVHKISGQIKRVLNPLIERT